MQGEEHAAQAMARLLRGLLVCGVVMWMFVPSVAAKDSTSLAPTANSNNVILSVVIIGSVCMLAACAGVAFLVISRCRAYSSRSNHNYAEPRSVTVHVEDQTRLVGNDEGDVRRGDHQAPCTQSHPDNQSHFHGTHDNYADRQISEGREGAEDAHAGNEGRWNGESEVRPASPNAERLEGIPIEARVRPRRNLPKGRVVVHSGAEDYCLDFSGVGRVPQAGPPPLTAEEKQRMEDERNRVASPEFYGQAAYEHRRGSNVYTPNVLLSSSLLLELQQQYSGHLNGRGPFSGYASEGSIRSLSLRPGSPAGSVRRAHHGASIATPDSICMAFSGGSPSKAQVRNRRDNSSFPGIGAAMGAKPQHQQTHGGSPPRRGSRQDVMESTSDDFDDTSLPNDSFHPRLEPLRAFLVRPPSAGILSPNTAANNGFDLISLHGASPFDVDRPMSTAASVVSEKGAGERSWQAAAAPSLTRQTHTIPMIAPSQSTAAQSRKEASSPSDVQVRAPSLQASLTDGFAFGVSPIPSEGRSATYQRMSSSMPAVPDASRVSFPRTLEGFRARSGVEQGTPELRGRQAVRPPSSHASEVSFPKESEGGFDRSR